MYTRAYDKEQHLLVTLFSGRSNSVDDFERAARDVIAADADAAGAPAGVVHVAEVESGNPVPDAAKRKVLQDAVIQSTRAPKYVVCLVTASTLQRAVLAALRWFTPVDVTHPSRGFARFEDAVAWAETHRPGIAARVLELRRAAREEAQANRPRS